MAKADRIKSAHVPPARISDDPAYYLCKAFRCPSYDVCHGGEFALRNCRTCLHASPAANRTWHCARFDHDLTTDAQRAGCPHHLYLPGLVPGEQVDADPETETVTYQLADGGSWVDGAERRAPQ